MALDAAQTQKVKDYFDRLGGPPKCPACGTTGWAAEEIVVAPDLIDGKHGGKRIGVGGHVTPMLQMVCDRCGFVAHFAARRMGLA